MMYDCDHLFVNPFDDSAFDIIKQHELISFHDPKQGDGSQARSERRTKLINTLGMTSDYLRPVNGGCVGSVKDSKLVKEWINALDQMLHMPNRFLRKVPDEYSLSYVMGKHNIPIGDYKWSYSVKPSEPSKIAARASELIGIHFPCGRYLESPFYVEKAKEAIVDNFMSLDSKRRDYEACNGIMKIL